MSSFFRYKGGMCGRAYQTYTEEELSLRYFNKKPLKLPKFKPNYNLSPTQLSPVIVRDHQKKELKFFQWGLIPHWAKDRKMAYKMINARSETITEKPSFREAVKYRRCIVPLSGFYEWRREDEVKQPFAISLKDSPILSLAGIWESWKDPSQKSGELVHTFSLITTEANSMMQKIHDRMPVILSPKGPQSEDEWLDSNLQDSSDIQKFLRPCPAKWLQAYEISTLVNSPRNNSEAVLAPLRPAVP